MTRRRDITNGAGRHPGRARLAAAALAAVLWVPASAAPLHPKAGSTAATFLKIGAGGRAVAMGEAYTALAAGAEGIYWNPAGLARPGGREFGAAHNASFEGLQHTYAGYRHPYRGGALGFTATALVVPGDLERRSGAGENVTLGDDFTAPEGTFGAYDVALGAGWGGALDARWSGGFLFKYIRQTIDGTSASAPALDLGLLYRSPAEGLDLGLSLLHLSPGIKFGDRYALPLTARAGAAYTARGSAWTWTFDTVKAADDFAHVNAGFEWRAFGHAAVRAGYSHRLNGNTLGAQAGLRAGVGVEFRGIGFDYAFAPLGDLGRSHRVALRLRLGALAARPDARPEPEAAAAEPEPLPAPTTAEVRIEPLATPPVVETSSAPEPGVLAVVTPKALSARGAEFALAAEFPGPVWTRLEAVARMPVLREVRFTHAAREPGAGDPKAPRGVRLLRWMELTSSVPLGDPTGTLTFELPKADLSAAGVDPSKAALVRVDETGRWNVLKTEVLANDGTTVRYAAPLRGFGTYAIMGLR